MIESRDGEEVTLDISGFSVNSSLAVEDIETIHEGDEITVLVNLVLAGKDRTGDFSYIVSVGPDVQRVLFGTRQRVIWSRGPVLE